MPSGGVTQENFLDYLSQPNVFAVSGSWIAPRELISKGEFSEITRRAKEALELAR
jgi:2-dehydro-3-deoxyphosphogluconate aldolase/(4S)-4-hydroxy-2-oxoglutarate aldolase